MPRIGFATFMILVARPLLRRWIRFALKRGGGELGLNSLAILVVVVFLSVGLSFGFMSSQARRIRRAMEAAEAERDRGAVCPECGADVPAGATRCVGCGFHFQVRCAECGSLADLKAAGGECPACGALLK